MSSTFHFLGGATGDPGSLKFGFHYFYSICLVLPIHWVIIILSYLFLLSIFSTGAGIGKSATEDI